jgi:hypothetical protein
MDIFQLQQHIKTPTRITPKTSTLIDVIFTYIGDKIIRDRSLPLRISDHSLVYLCQKLRIPKDSPKVILTRQYKKYNVNAFNYDLNAIGLLQIIRMSCGETLRHNILEWLINTHRSSKGVSTVNANNRLQT